MAKGIKVKTGSYVDFKVVPNFITVISNELAFPSLFFRETDVFGDHSEWKHIAEMNESETRALAAALLKSLEK